MLVPEERAGRLGTIDEGWERRRVFFPRLLSLSPFDLWSGSSSSGSRELSGRKEAWLSRGTTSHRHGGAHRTRAHQQEAHAGEIQWAEAKTTEESRWLPCLRRLMRGAALSALSRRGEPIGEPIGGRCAGGATGGEPPPPPGLDRPPRVTPLDRHCQHCRTVPLKNDCYRLARPGPRQSRGVSGRSTSSRAAIPLFPPRKEACSATHVCTCHHHHHSPRT